MPKITALPVASSVAATDLVPVVGDPSGTPETRQATAVQVVRGGLAGSIANNFWITGLNPGGSPLNMFQVDGSSRLQVWGSTGSFGNIIVNLNGAASLNIETQRFYITPSNLRCGLPLSGLSDASAAFRLKGSTIDCTAGGTITPAASVYECPMLTLTGTPGAAFTIVLPNAAESWFNIKNATAQDATIQRSGGTGFVLAAGSTRIAYHRGGDYEAR